MARPTLIATIDAMMRSNARAKRINQKHLAKHPDSVSAIRGIAEAEGALRALSCLRPAVPHRTEPSYRRHR